MNGSSNGRSVALASALLLCSAKAVAADAQPSSFSHALMKARPLAELRLRFETVDQEPLADNARATILRARLGFETGTFAKTSLLAEGEFVWPWRGNYRPDPAVATMPTYPVVADPEAYELNRLQLTNTALPGTTLTLGRQRINLDDQRFVGNVGWRMNEQTFDALRMVNKSISNLTIDAAWLARVNRIYGPDSPQGRYKGDTFLGNVAYQFKPGKLTAFAYLIDIEPVTGVPAAAGDSTATYGLRFAGDRMLGKTRLGYIASYAEQQEHADNPADLDLAYYLLELTATVRQLSVGAGYEVLEGNGTKGFATPLATSHRFQGWADKFLVTPVAGIEDLYFTAGWTAKGIGPFETLAATVVWHDFQAERTGASYGSEWNLQLQGRIGRFTGLLKYADYRADGLLTDTSKLWLQVEFAY